MAISRQGKGMIVALLLIAALPFIINSPYLLHVANMTGLMVILSLGLNLLFGYAGQISLGHGAFYGVGAYVSALLSLKAGFTFWIALPVGVAAGFGLAVVVGWPTLKLREHYLALATLGLSVMVQLVLENWTSFTGGAPGLPGINRPSLFGLRLVGEGQMFWLIGGLAWLVYLLLHSLVNSRYGRVLVAIRENEEAASALGINVHVWKVAVFGASGALAGLAGALFAHLNQYINPTNFGLDLSIAVLVATVIGGLGSNLGSLLGALVLTLLPEFLYSFQARHLLVYGTVLSLIIVFAPQGLAGLRLRRRPTPQPLLAAAGGEVTPVSGQPTASPNPVTTTEEAS